MEERLSPEDIHARFPLYSVDGIAGGTFGSADGHFDAHAVLMGYKAKARALGARYRHDEVVAIVTSGGRVTGVRLKSGHQLNAGYVANCAGAWASEIARITGIELPVKPVRVIVLSRCGSGMAWRVG